MSCYINDLAAEVHTIARSKGFWDEARNMGEMIALMHSELSEALEAHRDDNITGPHSVSEEFADVIIRVLDTCAAYEFDMDWIIARKMEINRQRPQLHGRKR